MPFVDADGDRVEKGSLITQEKTVSVTDSATVTMDELVSIDTIVGTRTEGEASVDESNDAAADGVQGTASNEVDVTLYTGKSADTLDTTDNQSEQTRSVTVIAEGY